MKRARRVGYKVIDEKSYECKQGHELEDKGDSSSKHVGSIQDGKRSPTWRHDELNGCFDCTGRLMQERDAG